MTAIKVKIEVKSPIHLNSGKETVNIDAEVVHDKCGIPFFPAKRFKGLLYESALETVEMAKASGKNFVSEEVLEEMFHHSSESSVQLIVSNFYTMPAEEAGRAHAEWDALLANFPEILRASDVLDSYTSVRYQTRLVDGVADDGSLHNMRVVDAGTDFFGTLELDGGDECHLALLACALRNLSRAGMKRNRGFGRIVCTMELADGRTEQELIEELFSKEAV